MICTVYSHVLGFEKLVEILKIRIPKGEITHFEMDAVKIIEIETTGSKLKISYRERIHPSYQLSESQECPLNESLKGIYGFVSSLPTKNESIKSRFLKKIQTLNAEFSISQESGTTKDLKTIILNLAIIFDAILFVQPDTIISKSQGQHFLDKNLNLILDQNGNCEIDDLVVTIDSKYYVANQSEATQEQKSRKDESEKILNSYNIKVNKILPYVESENETTIRSVKEVAQRVTVLAVTSSIAFNNMTGVVAKKYLTDHKLWETTTPNERDFIENPTADKKHKETWKCEGIWTLMWALNIIDALGFPDEMADLNKIPNEKYPIGKDKDPNDFINSQSQLRTKAEILNVNDLYYRMDWACVDARISGTQVSSINSGIVYERHYALNWLINYMDAQWDDVSCDT